ncbi:uncharacterized protein LOC142588926 [Dermacentor variabilis]|uniref:uncharacterized protein LOC142588926 n=1 Tax=Dermacentor variabilis TaxID=34621 RepID=UPI003F5C68DB
MGNAEARPWRILAALLSPKIPRRPALSIAVAQGLSAEQLAELFADTFAPPSVCPVDVGEMPARLPLRLEFLQVALSSRRTFDEIKQTAITAPEPFTSPLSCAWLAVVLIGLFVIVTVILTLCYTFKKGRPPLPTSPPVLHVTTPSQESGSQYITVANNSVASSDRDDGTSSSHVT